VIASSLLAIEGGAIVTDTDDPKLISIEIPLARLPSAWDGLTIVQLSDFHYDDRFSVVPIRKAIEMVKQLRPDLIVLTGDFVTMPLLFKVFHNSQQAARVAEPCAVLLGQLSAPLGVFAVLGNHDVLTDPDFIVESLQSKGMQVLRNRSVPLEREGKRLWLAGLDSALNGHPDLELTMHGVPGQEAVVLLVHEPDYARRVARYAVDLQLSGHSHGGQIVIPLVGAPYLPPLARRYPRGLYRLGPLTLYTNVGLGTIYTPARWNCPPEITFIKLRTAEKTR
jgi:predicted MPP superfamily phosphohydrolase